jgi:hypothetical protein
MTRHLADDRLEQDLRALLRERADAVTGTPPPLPDAGTREPDALHPTPLRATSGRRRPAALAAAVVVVLGLLAAATTLRTGDDRRTPHRVHTTTGAGAETEERIPPGVDLMSVPPLFTGDGSRDKVVRAYLSERFGALVPRNAMEIGWMGTSAGGSVLGPLVRARWSFVQNPPDPNGGRCCPPRSWPQVTGIIYVRRDAGSHSVVASLAEGASLAGITYDHGVVGGTATARVPATDGRVTVLAGVYDQKGNRNPESPVSQKQPAPGTRTVTMAFDQVHAGDDAVVRMVEFGGQVLGVSEVSLGSSSPSSGDDGPADMGDAQRRVDARAAQNCVGVAQPLPGLPYPSAEDQAAAARAAVDASDVTDSQAFPSRGFWTGGSALTAPSTAVRQFGSDFGADLRPSVVVDEGGGVTRVEAYLPNGRLVEVDLSRNASTDARWVVHGVTTVDTCGSMGLTTTSSEPGMGRVGFPVVPDATSGRLRYLAGDDPTKVLTLSSKDMTARQVPLRYPSPLRRWLLAERDEHGRVVALVGLVV